MKVVNKPEKIERQASQFLQEGSAPTIRYLPKAWEKVRWLVDVCPTEIGWVEAVEKIDDFLYIVHDVRAMEQERAPTTFSYTGEAWGFVNFEWLQQNLLSKDILDVGLGHSHVNMGCIPSGVDSKQMMDLINYTKDGDIQRNTDGTPKVRFNVQTIHNKKGDVYGAVYDWESSKRWKNCNVEVASSLTDADIEDLEMQLARAKPAPPITYKYSNTGKIGSSLGQWPKKKKQGGKPRDEIFSQKTWDAGEVAEWSDEEWNAYWDDNYTDEEIEAMFGTTTPKGVKR